MNPMRQAQELEAAMLDRHAEDRARVLSPEQRVVLVAMLDASVGWQGMSLATVESAVREHPLGWEDLPVADTLASLTEYPSLVTDTASPLGHPDLPFCVNSRGRRVVDALRREALL